MFISVLLFCGLALFLNVSSSSAASVNQTDTSISATSLDHTNSDTISSNYTTDKSNSNVNNDTSNVTVNSVSNPINNTMAAGAPVKVNGLTLAQLKSGTARVQAYFNKNGRLPKYVSFGKRKIPIKTFKKNIAKVGLKLNTIKVNGLTVYQIKVGISKVQLFYS
ncbi:MAG TPA: transglutaminase, partial [Methanobacterium sp.]